MDLSVWILICLMAICTSAEVESKPKSGRGKGSMWWGIAKVGEPNNIAPLNSKMVMYMDPAIHSTLRRKQRRLVREHPGVLAALVRGANMAISECQHQFRNRRWNCSTKNFQRGKNLFGKIVDRGCRETAFIYAITSAAVTHSVAKACSEGSIESCTCDYSHQFNHQAKNPKGAYWEWGGCSDNIGFGIKFARDFVDTGERGRNYREKMNLHNNEAGRMHVQAEMRKECKCHGMSGSCTVKTCWMRLPNFRVVGDNLKDRFDGATRIMVSNSLRGPDNVITNNNHMNMHLSAATALGNGGGGGGGNNKKNLLTSGNALNAIQVSNGISTTTIAGNAIHTNSVHHQRRNGNGGVSGGGGGLGGQNAYKKNNRYNLQLKPYNPDHKTPESSDLVFLEPSPGFCEKNPRLGIQGTHGRQCNDTSMGMDGCDLMCCGRGYRTEEITVVERCACMFHWCCEVKCKLCRTQKTIHTCL